MLLVNVFIAGGVIYAGIKTYISTRPRQRNMALVSVDNASSDGASARDEASSIGEGKKTVEIAILNGFSQVEEKVHDNFTLSTCAVALAALGSILYPPLAVVSVPITVYVSIPIFEDTYRGLINRRSFIAPFISSVGITAFLISENYFIASLVQWVYYYIILLTKWLHDINQRYLVDFEKTYQQILMYVFGGRPQSVWVLFDDVELAVPFAALKIGDIVVVNEGEIIPIEGVITEGSALVDLYLLTGVSQPIDKEPGDQVSLFMVVRSGRICIRVDKIV